MVSYSGGVGKGRREEVDTYAPVSTVVRCQWNLGRNLTLPSLPLNLLNPPLSLLLNLLKKFLTLLVKPFGGEFDATRCEAIFFRYPDRPGGEGRRLR